MHARGETAQRLRAFAGSDPFAQVQSLNLRQALAQRELLQVFELRYAAGSERGARVAELLRALFAGEPRVVLLAHGTGRDDAIAGIVTHGFLLPPLKETEDIMGHGVFATCNLSRAAKHKWSNCARWLKGGTRFTRGQGLVVLCIADLRGGNVITTNDPEHVRWPRKHETEAGTTARLLNMGNVARQYRGPGHPAGHELCVFDPARLVPVALGLWPRR